jgi:uncharacterized NAD(P)/FAD-binding protein YdhS
MRVQSSPLRLAICGGGASAVLLLENLARTSGRRIRVELIEPRSQLARGVAYSTECPLHLLNVPAGRMSSADDSTSFLRWLQAAPGRSPRPWGADDFAPRELYGRYLEWLLERVSSSPNIDLTWHRTAALQLTRAPGEWRIELARGPAVRADAVVLATGAAPAALLGEHLPGAARGLVLEDPWDAGAKHRIPADAPVLLAGSGLTAVDVALELLYAQHHRGPLVAFSRRGLWPRPHGARTPPDPAILERLACAASVRELVRLARELAAQDPSGAAWRGFMDELRRTAGTIWGALDASQRRQFMRHVRPFWEAHRHRMAPAIYARLAAALAAGRLTLLRGRLERVDLGPSPGLLDVRLRQGAGSRTLQVARLINCTGPAVGPRQGANPLLRNLIRDGLAQPDALGLGMATADGARLVSASGRPQPSLFALGALARGGRFELTAIPEIAAQARAISQEILTLQPERTSPDSSLTLSAVAGRLGSVTAAVSPTCSVRAASA